VSRELAGAQPAAAGDVRFLESLRNGDEASFCSLINRHHASMIRLARIYVPSEAVAEEVVQETWMGVLEGLDRFEGRSSLTTWMFRILTNIAKKRGAREGRSIPFSSVWDAGSAPAEPAVEPERFFDAGHSRYPGGWVSFPTCWDGAPEARLLSTETLRRIDDAIAGLPPSQREVVTLRDLEGLTGPEVCAILSITEGNQRILLHRARSKIRRAIEQYLAEGSA
jgi:RNA polymerase sigma-70 factor (ECF subfamily)